MIINPYVFVGFGGGYDSDAQAMFDARAAVGDEPPTAYKQAISDWIITMKAVSGWWSSAIQVWTCAGATTVNGARIAIKGNNMIARYLVDADIFAKTGTQGNAVNKAWDTQYSAAPAGTGQNNFHTYAYFSSVGSGSNILYGSGNTITGTWNQRQSGSTRCFGSSSDSNTSPVGAGGYGMNRSTSGSYERIVANTIGSVSRNSLEPYNGRHTLLAGNYSNAHSNARILVYVMGASISTLAAYISPTADFITALNSI